jgi:trans-2,3-dihydro-3-hydroxyanthranilate isomerase
MEHSKELYAFVLVDVFTDHPFSGNPLAVFPNANKIDAETMQALAREFNFSETTFVLPPRNSRAERRLRCFSPFAEVFGAGHNALGAWWVVVSEGHVNVKQSSTVFQELGDRLLPVEISFDSGALRLIAMTQPIPRESTVTLDRSALARALDLDETALSVPALDLCVVTAGATSHLLVPLRTLADLRRVHVQYGELSLLARQFGCEGCYCFCLETLDKASLAHARGFFPGIGIAEDPATGSAAGPLAGYLAARRVGPKDVWVTIEQGDEVGRPGRIKARVTDERIQVGGECAIVGAGEISVWRKETR